MANLKSDNEDKKLFYRIGDVSKQLNVAPSLLRFWEKELECLQEVKKTRKGDRLYTDENIIDLKLIHKLVKEKGYTLSGANDFMKKHGKEQSVYNSLMKIRAFLENLKENL